MAQELMAHPTVIRLTQREPLLRPTLGKRDALDAAWLRQLCLEAGADDVGFVAIDRPELDGQRDDILAVFPRAQALISYVVRMNREPIRSPARSVANLEFHHSTDHAEELGQAIVTELERHGVRALNPAIGFPMEMSRWPGKTWVVSYSVCHH